MLAHWELVGSGSIEAYDYPLVHDIRERMAIWLRNCPGLVIHFEGDPIVVECEEDEDAPQDTPEKGSRVGCTCLGNHTSSSRGPITCSALDMVGSGYKGS